MEALKGADPLGVDLTSLSTETLECIQWRIDRDSASAKEYREQVIRNIENAGQRFWEAGEAEEWMRDADSYAKRMCREVNGPLAW